MSEGDDDEESEEEENIDYLVQEGEEEADEEEGAEKMNVSPRSRRRLRAFFFLAVAMVARAGC